MTSGRPDWRALVRETAEMLADFEREAVLSLVHPRRVAEWKTRFHELRVRLEQQPKAEQ